MLTNNEKSHLFFSILLGVLYIVAKCTHTNNTSFIILIVIGIIVSFILALVFAFKSSSEFLTTLWHDYRNDGDIVSGFFAIVYMASISLLVVFFIMQLVNGQIKELTIMFRDIILGITPMGITLLGIHYKANFLKKAIITTRLLFTNAKKVISVKNRSIKNLVFAVIEKSDANNWEDAVLEWDLIDCEEDESLSSYCVVAKRILNICTQ